jgi:hypothetical protein
MLYRSQLSRAHFSLLIPLAVHIRNLGCLGWWWKRRLSMCGDDGIMPLFCPTDQVDFVKSVGVGD